MSTDTVSPLRQRMIEDMNARKLCAGPQTGHIRSCKRFAAFLKRSPDRPPLRISAAPPVPHFPRFPALALFGRRSPERVDGIPCRRPKTCTISDIRTVTRSLRRSAHAG